MGPPPGTPGITVVAQLQSDTVGARVPPLRLQVRDAAGKLAAGTAVELEAILWRSPCPGTCQTVPTLLMDARGDGTLLAAASLTTDAQGAVSSGVVLGRVAGQAGLVVRVPRLGYTETLAVTVQPGVVAAIRFSPPDTAVQVGRAYTLAATATDRYDNPRTDPVVLTTTSPDVALQGERVSGVAFGRAEIRASAGPVSRTAHVTVVPAGTLAVTRVSPAATRVMELDGSEVRTLASAPEAAVAQWSRDASRLLMLRDVLDQPDRIQLHEPASGATRTVLDVASHPRVRHAASPRFSPDGEWIWFSGYEAAAGNALLWRMRPDGSGLELLTSQTSHYLTAEHPSPAPDGTRLVYSGRRTEEDWQTLYVLDMAAGTHTPMYGNGAARPEWSPTGEWISFTPISSGNLYLIRPDGSGLRQVTHAPALSVNYTGVWSPDGAWLLAVNPVGAWLLVEVATGKTAALPERMTDRVVAAAWKP